MAAGHQPKHQPLGRPDPPKSGTAIAPPKQVVEVVEAAGQHYLEIAAKVAESYIISSDANDRGLRIAVIMQNNYVCRQIAESIRAIYAKKG